MATIRDEAVCVRIWDWSETSQTVSLLTREHGVIRGLAKGAKRDQGAFSGGFELATLGEMVAIVKREGQLATLTAWDLREPFADLRRDLNAFYAACALTEIAQASVNDHDPHPGLFEALAAGLQTCARAPIDSAVGFLWAALVETGYRPRLQFEHRDRAVHEEPGRVHGFDPSTGGLVQDPGPGSSAEVWRVRSDTIGRLRQIADEKGGFGAGGGDLVQARVLKLLSAYTRGVLGRELPALTLLVERLARFG